MQGDAGDEAKRKLEEEEKKKKEEERAAAEAKAAAEKRAKEGAEEEARKVRNRSGWFGLVGVGPRRGSAAGAGAREVGCRGAV